MQALHECTSLPPQKYRMTQARFDALLGGKLPQGAHDSRVQELDADFSYIAASIHVRAHTGVLHIASSLRHGSPALVFALQY
jgi:hypothetical protein